MNPDAERGDRGAESGQPVDDAARQRAEEDDRDFCCPHGPLPARDRDARSCATASTKGGGCETEAWVEIQGSGIMAQTPQASWREDNRRVPNGDQVSRVTGLALASKPSVDFTGYWQRHDAK